MTKEAFFYVIQIKYIFSDFISSFGYFGVRPNI